MKELIHYIMFCAVFVGIVLICATNSSCKITAEGIKMLSGDFESPELKSFNVEDSSHISVTFSEDVLVNFATVAPCAIKSNEEDIKNTSLSKFEEETIEIPLSNVKDITTKENQSNKDEIKLCTLLFTLPFLTELGKNYQLYGEVKDKAGNTLSFSIPFYGYNENIPVVILSEVRDVCDSKNNRFEFIEICALTSGNLFGLELFSVQDNLGYDFPNMEVKQGDYISVHLRNTNGEKSSQRALYVDNSSPRLGSSCDVILLRKKNDGTIIDALPYATTDYVSKNEDWKSQKFKDAVSLSCKDGAWAKDENLSSAFVFKKPSTATRSLSRKNVEALKKAATKGALERSATTKDDWYISQKATPGSANSAEYVPRR